MDQARKHIILGKIGNQNKGITLKVQREIVKCVISTHKTLTQYYPDVAKYCRKTWCDWIAGGISGILFHKFYLPYNVIRYWDVWDAPFSQGIDTRDITTAVLDIVKNLATEMLVRMYVVSSSMLQSIAVRRSEGTLQYLIVRVTFE